MVVDEVVGPQLGGLGLALGPVYRRTTIQTCPSFRHEIMSLPDCLLCTAPKNNAPVHARRLQKAALPQKTTLKSPKPKMLQEASPSLLSPLFKRNRLEPAHSLHTLPGGFAAKT
ncbi:hypothetical protein L596_006261 [Steinernema carpocapsae]|uniref:Uncharacterized protein n=1 Tax=Steinernema carpocapsae TaxID=34508 RepID=A0A4V6I8Y6_STECR|nr:hypothetical protein L596_006261 [Steinernema carpocapsae]